MSQRIVAVDSQRLDAIQLCMFNYKNRFGVGIEPGRAPLQTPSYFEEGGLLHEMLAQLYKLKKYRGRWHQNNKTYADIVDSCVTVGRHVGNRMDLDIAEIEKVIDTFREYAEFWENDGWDQIVGVEQVGSKILHEEEDLIILYEVKIDLIISLQNCPVLPVDHKSAKSHRAPNELSNQFKGYCWYLGCHNILVNEVGFQKTYKPVDKFRRHTLSFTQNILDEWVRNSVYWIKWAIGHIDENFFPRNFTSCDKYSGCTYRDVCIADPEARDYKLRSMYKEKPWDVGEENL